MEDISVLIVRNLEGLADSNEISQLVLWIESSEENRRYYENVKNIWDNSDRKINIDNIDSARALKNVYHRIHFTTSKRRFWLYWQKIAAILILPLLIGSLLLVLKKPYKNIISSNEIVYNEIYAAYGTRSSLRLSDSTLVWLNAGSYLKYPVKFDNRNRKVFLKGEAYFEVESDISRPFLVETSALKIKAIGTKFNVNEYVSSPTSEVTLVTGRLVVNTSDLKNDFHFTSELNQNQHLVFNRLTKEGNISNEDTYKYISWKDGKLIFRSESLDKILTKLSLMFNVDIEIQGADLQQYRYHATFQNESFEEILKLLTLSAPIGYKEEKRDPLPDGSFPKKKVIVYPLDKKL
jgi:ferric-dicitrate binding protein FerR (iron transport regulator)